MMDSCPNVRSATVGGWEGLGSGLSLVTEDENLVLLRVTFELSSLVMCFLPFSNERISGCVLCRRIEKETRRRR